MTDTTNDAIKRTKPRLSAGTVKLAGLAGLVLAALIPVPMISSLITEREANQTVADNAIDRIWGPEQVVAGPTIIIAKTRPNATAGSQPLTIYERIVPKAMNAEIELAVQKRHRGFFDTTVYGATLHVHGSFAPRDLVRTEGGSPPDTGFLAINLNSLTGVASTDSATISGESTTFQPFEEPRTDCRGYGRTLVVPVKLKDVGDELPFEATLHLRGTRRFQIAALGRAMNATVKGTWATPGFTGDEPPIQTNIKDNAFAARWQVDRIGAPVPIDTACALGNWSSVPTFGVDLVDSVPVYRMVTRATKYAPFFVVIAFAAYFLFELLTGVVINILQYALMAASLTLFALLLVSLGEIVGYAAGFATSAALVTAQASIYTRSVTRRIRPAAGFAALLAGLFGGLYVLLGIESYALVVGTAALFIVLSIVMAVTQHVQTPTTP